MPTWLGVSLICGALPGMVFAPACGASFAIFAAKLIDRDLAAAVSTPSLYQFEDILRAFAQGQIDAVLAVTRRDRSQTGLRDYAMLLMLATTAYVPVKCSDYGWKISIGARSG